MPEDRPEDRPQRQRVVIWVGDEDTKEGTFLNGHCQAWEMRVSNPPPEPDRPHGAPQHIESTLPSVSFYMDAVEVNAGRNGLEAFIENVAMSQKLEHSRKDKAELPTSTNMEVC